jgi:glycosyltransferase 2 family protein
MIAPMSSQTQTNAVLRPLLPLYAWLKQHHRPIGLVVGLAGVIFVGFRLHGDLAGVDWGDGARVRLLIAAAVTVIFFLLCFGLGVGWWSILKALRQEAPVGWAVRAFGLSQIAKYLPGNVFHLASRQVIAAGRGLDAKAVGLSQLGEIALLAVVAATYGCFLLPYWFAGLGAPLPSLLFVAAQVLLVLALARAGWRKSVIAICVYHLYFVAGGVCLVLLTTADLSVLGHGAMLLIIVAASAVSWVVGLLTPGAPAGIGVRETLLILALDRIGLRGEVALAVVLLRCATILADVAFFAFCAATERSSSKGESHG